MYRNEQALQIGFLRQKQIRVAKLTTMRDRQHKAVLSFLSTLKKTKHKKINKICAVAKSRTHKSKPIVDLMEAPNLNKGISENKESLIYAIQKLYSGRISGYRVPLRTKGMETG